MINSEHPLVSVIIPAYNHDKYVERAIHSVLTQTYPHIELIVVDDGSTDDTLAVIEQVRSKSKKDFKVIAKKNGGVSSALNAGIAASHGEYIAILASDDWFLPEKTARQIAMFSAADRATGMVHANGLIQSEDGGPPVNLLGSYRPAEGLCFKELVARGVTAIAPSIMVRRTVVDEVGGFDETLVGEDLDFYAAVAAQGYAIGFDPSPQIVKSARGDNLGTKVELFFNDPFVTLAKYRDRFTVAEYTKMENGFYAGMGRAAAGVGKLSLSWHAYLTLSRRKRNATPLVEFAVQNARHLLLAALPQPVRSSLRRARAQIRAGSDS